jgi:GAF domain-containing protein
MTAQLQRTLSRLENRVDARTRALEAGAEVSRSISTILDQEQLMTEVVEEVRSAFDYYHVHVYLLDEANNALRMAGGTGEAGLTMLRQGHVLPMGEGLVGEAAVKGETVLVSDVAQNPTWISNPLLPDTKAEIAVPISLGGQVLGVLDVQEDAVDGLSSEDARLLNLVANQIAVALRNARLYEQVRRQAQQTEVVNEVGERIQAAQDIEHVLQVTAQELGRTLPISRARVQLGRRTDEQNGR